MATSRPPRPPGRPHPAGNSASRRRFLRALVGAAGGGTWLARFALARAQESADDGSRLVELAPPAPTGTVLVAYARDENVWLMRADGAAKRALTADGVDPFDPGAGYPRRSYPWFAWAPGGRHLALLREEHVDDASAPATTLVVVDADGRAGPEVPNVLALPSWSGDGTAVAVARAVSPAGFELVVLEPATGATVVPWSSDRALALGPAWAIDAPEIAVGTLEGDPAISPLRYAVFRVGPAGEATSMPGFETQGQAVCIGEAVFVDPAADRYRAEGGPGPAYFAAPTLQWSAADGLAVYNVPGIGCAGYAWVADLDAGTAETIPYADVVLSPRLRLALPGRSPDESIAVAAARPVGAPIALGLPGDLPTWSPSGDRLYFVQRRFLDESFLESATGAQLLITRVVSSIWSAASDGSDLEQLVEEEAFGFGPPRVTPDGRSLIFSRVDNATDLWERRLPGDRYDDELLRRYPPEVSILRLDLGTAALTTLARGAGRPTVESGQVRRP